MDTNDIEFIEDTTDFVEAIFTDHNKRRKEDDLPSIEIWYDMYIKEVIGFNSIIQTWNEKFNTQTSEARVPCNRQ